MRKLCSRLKWLDRTRVLLLAVFFGKTRLIDNIRLA